MAALGTTALAALRRVSGERTAVADPFKTIPLSHPGSIHSMSTGSSGFWTVDEGNRLNLAHPGAVEVLRMIESRSSCRWSPG